MTLPAVKSDLGEPSDKEEVTIERRVSARPRPPLPLHPTTRMAKIDDRLLSIARGELDPQTVSTAPPPPTVPRGPASCADDDPYGGLIPVTDEDVVDEAEVEDVDDGWVLPEPGTPRAAQVSLRAVPKLRIGIQELVELPIDHRCGFVLSQIDGTRSIEELVDICQLRTSDAFEVIEELFTLGAIDLK